MKTFLKTILFAVVAGLVITGGYAGVAFIRNKRVTENVQQILMKYTYPAESISAVKNTEIQNTDSTSVYDVSCAAECAMPALVSVDVTAVAYSYDFFGRQYSYEESGNASGIIAAQNYGDLLIVTNNHVVEGASKVSVTFIDGTSAPAEIKSTEESEDLAVINVKIADISEETLSKIRIATFADSEELVPGEMVIAIGNALGYGQSVTVGYVSALNREVTIEGYTLSLIQTDVAINPGNSGGALLNSRGQVVGINNAKIADSKVEGICYAIPTSTAIPIIDELMIRKTLPEGEQAFLGIAGQVVTSDMATLYKLPRGIYIKEVLSGSPADKAGIRPGDVLIALNGKKVMTQERYEKIASYTPGGSEGTVTVKRLEEGEYREEVISVVFGRRSDN